jgi:hypothetical protein
MPLLCDLAFVEACRYPIHKEDVGQDGLQEGRRGIHGAPMASEIWELLSRSTSRKQIPGPSVPTAN